MRGKPNPYSAWSMEKLIENIDLLVANEAIVEESEWAKEQLQLLRAARNERL